MRQSLQDIVVRSIGDDTIKDYARRCGLSHKLIQDIIGGKYKGWPRVDTVRKLSAATGVSAAALYDAARVGRGEKFS